MICFDIIFADLASLNDKPFQNKNTPDCMCRKQKYVEANGAMQPGAQNCCLERNVFTFLIQLALKYFPSTLVVQAFMQQFLSPPGVLQKTHNHKQMCPPHLEFLCCSRSSSPLIWCRVSCLCETSAVILNQRFVCGNSIRGLLLRLLSRAAERRSETSNLVSSSFQSTGSHEDVGVAGFRFAAVSSAGTLQQERPGQVQAGNSQLLSRLGVQQQPPSHRSLRLQPAAGRSDGGDRLLATRRHTHVSCCGA